MNQITVLNGPERRRRWHEDDRVRILEAAFAPGATVTEVARRFDVSTSLIYKWRAALREQSVAPGLVPAILIVGQTSDGASGKEGSHRCRAGGQHPSLERPAGTPPRQGVASPHHQSAAALPGQ